MYEDYGSMHVFFIYIHQFLVAMAVARQCIAVLGHPRLAQKIGTQSMAACYGQSAR